jgi:serine/threonine protein kinase
MLYGKDLRADQSKKSRTTGDQDGATLISPLRPKRNRSKTTGQPTPEPEVFNNLSEKKRGRINLLKVPNTPMKRSQSDEERTQKERYDMEISSQFPSRIEISQTKSSIVYRVQESSGAIYALKELKPDFLSKKKKLQNRALLEYHYAEMLHGHPNLVQYLKYWNQGPYICFLMEYLPGGSLDKYLQANPLHDPETNIEKEILWYFMLDLLTGLCFMHKKKLVHGDIKPSNIFLAINTYNLTIPTLKIGDFGITRSMRPSKESIKKGDGQYLAPELLDSNPQISTAVDIFSLGVALYEMATDYTANDTLWNKICQNDISYDKMSKELKIIVARMICRDPTLRMSARDCLCTNSKLQEIAMQLGIEPLGDEESSNEEMIDAQSLESDKDDDEEEVPKAETPDTPRRVKKGLDPVRKKLF